MANRMAGTSGQRRPSTARKTAPAKRNGQTTIRATWKRVLERNLIREGYSPAEAKELVALSAV
jgi:hypothetical protein